ncbi:MAG: DNA gyrase subunit A, partial [Streptosporangiaceae bacterium]
PEAVLEELYRLTPMEETFGINNVALVDGQPRVLGLREMLAIYVDHRIEVVRRRTAFRRAKRADRLHLVDGLIVALLNIDEIIQVIRESDDAAAALARLMAVFDLTRIQAQYILDTPLRRLTRFDRIELERERAVLQSEIAGLTAILESESRLREVVSDELASVSKRFATPRRTVLLEGNGAARTPAMALEVANDACMVLLSSAGLLARTADGPQRGQGHQRAAHDVIVSSVESTVRGAVGVITSQGRLIRVGVLELPALPPSDQSPGLAGGAAVSEFVSLGKGETVVGVVAAQDASAGLVLGTALGVVKRVAPDYPQSAAEFDVISLKDGDRVVGAVQLADERHDLVFITSDAQLLRFAAESVRPQGRTAGGMAGIRLSPGAAVTWFGTVDPAGTPFAVAPPGDTADGPSGGLPGMPVVVTVADSTSALPGTAATVKVTPYSEFPAKGRATGGVRCHRFLKGEDTLVLAWAGPGPSRGATAAGAPVELPPAAGRRDGSGERVRQLVAAIGGTAPPG